MKKIILSAAALILAATGHAQITVNLVRTYDPQTPDPSPGTGTIQLNATGAAISDTAITSYAGFKAAVATAFDSGLGGVFNGETGLTGTPTTNYLEMTYAGGLKSFRMNFTNVVGASGLRQASYGSAQQLSGVQNIDIQDAAGGTREFTLSFTNLPTDELITAFGIGGMARTNSNSGTVTITATFTDSSTATLSHSFAPNTPANTGNVFFGFAAPTGLGISSININRTGIIPFDDFGFVTTAIPEPSTYALLIGGLAALGLIKRYRSVR